MPEPTVRLAGEKLRAAPGLPLEVTCTGPIACPKPEAVAVILADPIPTPVMATRVDPVPLCGIKILGVFTVTTEGLVLVRVTKIPPEGAGFAKVMG